MKTLNIIVQEKLDKIKDKNDPKRIAKREKAEAFGQTPEGMDAIAKQQSMNEEIQNVKVGVMASTAIVGIGIQLLKNVVNYKMSGIQYETGDSNYAAQVQEAYGDTMNLIGYGASIIGGGTAGAVFGPIGAVVGASVAAISGGINMGYKYIEETRKFNYSIWEDTIKVDYNKARANINLYGGGRLR